MSNLVSWWHARNLDSDDAEKRRRAVSKLGSSANPSAVASLIAALEDEDPNVRIAAVESLQRIGPLECSEPLLKVALHDPEPAVCELAALALHKISPERTQQELLTALDGDDVQVRLGAARAIRTACWESLSAERRAQVAVTEGCWAEAAELGDAAVEPLRVALAHGTPRNQREAAESLGRAGSPRALQAVLSVLRDSSLEMHPREIAAWALRAFCWGEVHSSDLALAAIVAGDFESAKEIGAAAVEPLTTALRDPNTQIREAAAQALGKIPCDQALTALATTLTDKEQDAAVRTLAAAALSGRMDNRAAPAFVEALEDEAWTVRTAAAAGLDQLLWRPEGTRQQALYALARKAWEDLAALGPTAVAPLVDALRYSAVGWDVARCLSRMGPEGTDALVEAIKDRQRELPVREVAAAALAEAGDPRAAEALRTMLKDPDMAVRQSAVWTLERTGWEPSTDSERALQAVAHDDWDTVKALGSAAVETLVRLAVASLAADQTVDALLHILENQAGHVAIAHLRQLAELEDCRVHCSAPTEGDGSSGIVRIVDCALVRRRAKEELQRRGITA